jgi:hypothetical protein
MLLNTFQLIFFSCQSSLMLHASLPYDEKQNDLVKMLAHKAWHWTCNL